MLSVHLISGEAQWNKAAPHYVIWLQGGQCCIPGEQKALEEWKGVASLEMAREARLASEEILSTGMHLIWIFSLV